jgi:hypothetical protein
MFSAINGVKEDLVSMVIRVLYHSADKCIENIKQCVESCEGIFFAKCTLRISCREILNVP